MKRILMRAGKSPFENISPERVFWDDLIAKNSGNLLFAHSAYKMLSAPGTEIDVTRYRNPPPAEADEINERYDQFILPLANAFRPDFEPQLKRLTGLIRKLKIPVVVVGVGAQAEIDAAPGAKRKTDETVKAFVSAVLDRSHSIGVRGEFSAAYLHGLGFKSVKVIGCPSMFLHGDRLSVAKKRPGLADDARIAFNLTGGMPESLRPFCNRLFSDNKVTYVPQNRGDLSMLLWSTETKPGAAHDTLPRNSAHPIISSGRTKYFTDVPTWMSFLGSQEFSLGTRIHGNVFAILAGTPGFVIAHDSRTLELARYFEIPHRSVDRITEMTTVAELYDEADYGPTVANHAARYATYRQFLVDNGIDPIFDHPGAAESWNEKMAATVLPEPVTPIAAGDKDVILRRLGEFASAATARIAVLEKPANGEQQQGKKGPGQPMKASVGPKGSTQPIVRQGPVPVSMAKRPWWKLGR